MSTPRPHSTADLALAPVLIEIDQSLARLRSSEDLQFDLALELNDDDSRYKNAVERADRIRQYAIRGLQLHGWHVRPTQDFYGLVVEHSGYQVSLMFGKQLTGYIEHGATLEGTAKTS
jgi:hypothetical protein